MVIVMTADLDTSTVFVTMALIAMTARVALFKLTSRGSDPHLQTSTATSRNQYTRDDFGILPPLICLQRQQEMQGIPIVHVMLATKCAGMAIVIALHGNTPPIMVLECAMQMVIMMGIWKCITLTEGCADRRRPRRRRLRPRHRRPRR